jgi:hypothetical protein
MREKGEKRGDWGGERIEEDRGEEWSNDLVSV